MVFGQYVFMLRYYMHVQKNLCLICIAWDMCRIVIFFYLTLVIIKEVLNNLVWKIICIINNSVVICIFLSALSIILWAPVQAG